MFVSCNAMYRFIPIILLFLTLLPMPVMAQINLSAEIGILPPAPGSHPDLEDLLQRFWRDYYNVEGPQGFTMDNVRVGRADLNDDGNDELILMIDAPAWRAEGGKPFVIATWHKDGWYAIGWGWGDEDTIFTLTETNNGWHSLDTGTSIMRWTNQEYTGERKVIAPLAPQNP